MHERQTENHVDITLVEKISRRWQTFSDWVWQTPGSGEGFFYRKLRDLLRIIFIVVRESRNDRITLRASALTFTVVLSLVPMLALGTAVLKGLGAGDQMRQAAYSFIDQFEPAAPDATTSPDKASDQAGDVETIKPTEPEPAGLTSHLRQAIDQIFSYVDRTDFTTLGTVGIIGMVLAALSLLGSIEQSMNSIWQTTTGRAFGRKIIDYMALMILLPLSVNIALAAAAALQSPTLQTHIQNFIPLLWMQKLFFRTLPMAVLIITFSLLYQFLPNTRVGFLAALAGGVFGGITWFWVQMLYVKLQIGVARYNAIYGSFATLPLFFLWIYVAWLVFLLGAEVAFAFQAWRQYQWATINLTPAARLALAFDVMEAALEDYNERRITDRKSLADALDQPEKTIGIILSDLINGGLLLPVEAKLEGYVPAAPLQKLKPSEIMDAIFGRELPAVKGCDLARQALESARGYLDRYTLDCREATPHDALKAEDTHHGIS